MKSKSPIRTSQLTEDELKAVHIWEEDLPTVTDIRLLHRGKKGEYSDLPDKELWKISSDLGSVIEKSPKFKGLVFRGLRLDAKAAQELEVAKELTLATLSSATKKAKIAELFADLELDFLEGSFKPHKGPRAILQLKVKSGTDISKIAQFPEHEEVLLSRGTKFKVISRQWFGEKLVIYAKEF